MENVQISLHERLQFKEFFIKEYQSMTIPIWLDTNLKWIDKKKNIKLVKIG